MIVVQANLVARTPRGVVRHGNVTVVDHHRLNLFQFDPTDPAGLRDRVGDVTDVKVR